MTKLIVDGKEIDVPADYTLLQACEAAGANASAPKVKCRPRMPHHRRSLFHA